VNYSLRRAATPLHPQAAAGSGDGGLFGEEDLLQRESAQETVDLLDVAGTKSVADGDYPVGPSAPVTVRRTPRTAR
jgi:hypothetical protein